MKKFISIFIIILILFGIYKFISKPTSNSSLSVNQDNPDLILYVGNGCPHCKIVEDYIKNNSIDQKIKINQKEVFENKSNQAEMVTQVNSFCKELNNSDGIGVPIAIDPQNHKCIQGDKDIIDFLTQKTGQINK